MEIIMVGGSPARNHVTNQPVHRSVFDPLPASRPGPGGGIRDNHLAIVRHPQQHHGMLGTCPALIICFTENTRILGMIVGLNNDDIPLLQVVLNPFHRLSIGKSPYVFVLHMTLLENL